LLYVSLGDDDDEGDDNDDNNDGFHGASALSRSARKTQMHPRPRLFRRSPSGQAATTTVKVVVPAPPSPAAIASSTLGKEGSSEGGNDRSPPRPSSMRRLFRKLGFHHGGGGGGVAGAGEALTALAEDCDSSRHYYEKQLLAPSPTDSYTTIDETDEDEEDVMLLPSRQNHASIPAAQERTIPTAVRWFDQQLGGSIVTSVLEFPYVRPAYLRVVILLLHPVIRRFEFLHCELPEQRLTVWDLLQQLPGLATEPSLKHVAFNSLCRHRRSCKRRKKKRRASQTKQLIELNISTSTSTSTASSSSSSGSVVGGGSSGSYEDDVAQPDDEILEGSATDPKQVELIHRLDVHCYELFEGEILLAIPNGFHPKSIINHTDAMLENRQLMRMLHRAKLSGRALRRLKPSKTYESPSKSAGSRSPRSLHHSPRSGASPPPPPPPPPPLSPYSLKPKSRSTPPASPKVYQQAQIHGRSPSSPNSPPKSPSPLSPGSPGTTPPRVPSRRSKSEQVSPPRPATTAAERSEESPRSVIVKQSPLSHRSILQPDLLEGNTEAELEAQIHRAIQRELFLLRRADRVDAYQNGLGNGNKNAVVDDGVDDDDDGIVQTDMEDDPAAPVTEDERFFGSICTDPLSPQGRQSPFEFPRLTESTTSSAPAECQSLVARNMGGDNDDDHDSSLSWEKWIAHYFMCGSDAR
jgi:hypothetical protein